jgi:hypothetical protein
MTNISFIYYSPKNIVNAISRGVSGAVRKEFPNTPSANINLICIELYHEISTNITFACGDKVEISFTLTPDPAYPKDNIITGIADIQVSLFKPTKVWSHSGFLLKPVNEIFQSRKSNH